MTLLTVVIPALNEAGGIGDIVRRVLAQREPLASAADGVDLELIVVDDGSTDGTAEIAGAIDGCGVVRHERNRGYGGALKTGFEAARGDWLAFLDADGTYPPEALPEMCDAMRLTGADMVVGSRLAGGGGRMPLVRRIGNTFYVHLVRWLSGEQLTDAASGMRVMTVDGYRAMLPLPDGLDFTPAMTTRALHEGLRVREVPIDYEERVGRSKLSIVRDGWRFLRTIVGIAHTYDPLRLYGAASAVMLIAALLLGVQPVWRYLTMRRVEDWEIYRLFTILVLGVTGVNLATFGLFVGSLLASVYDRPLRARNVLVAPHTQEWIVRNAVRVGVLLIVAAPVLNHWAIWQYLTTGTVSAHWSYVLTGAFLFLVGINLLMLAALLNTLRAATRHLQALGRLHRQSAARAPRDETAVATPARPPAVGGPAFQ